MLWRAVAVMFVTLGCARYESNQSHDKANYPALGNVRYILESVRPEIRQYFIEADTDKSGVPFDRAHRNIAYQRAKAMTGIWVTCSSRTGV